MRPEVAAFLAQPVSGRIGQPLRVAIYSRIADGIRASVFVPGSALPNEIEMGEFLGVSRTVVREALMLLEEDGLIVTRRGIGRFVATDLPRIGLEQFRPLEEIVAMPDLPVSVRRVASERQTVTEYSAGALKLAPDAHIWFFESILTRGGEKIALVQEYLPAGEDMLAISPAFTAILPELKQGKGTVLGGVIAALGQKLSRSGFDITVGVCGAIRGRQLGIRPTDPVLLMNQTVYLGEQPVYLAKHVVSPKAGHLSVTSARSSE
jgi:GntR family transcriptional regulator